MDVDNRQQVDILELQQEQQRLLFLNRIAMLIAEHYARPSLLQPVLHEIQRFFSVDGAGVYQLENLESPRFLTANIGIPDDLIRELHKIPVGKGLTEQVLLNRAPCNWTDLRCEPQLFCQAVLDGGWRSLLSIPLVAEDQPIGVLFLFQRIPRQFSRQEIKLLEEVCQILAGAILPMELLRNLEWQQQKNEAGQRELERSRSQLRAHLMRLEESNRALEQTNRSKTRFLSLASHELKTPLTCILSAVELLEMKLPDLSEENAQLLQTVTHGALRLQNLIEDLLEMARIESRDLYLANEPLDLESTFKQLKYEFATRMQQRELIFKLAPLPDGFLLSGDRHHMQRALCHLLDNAIKYTPADGRIELTTTCCPGRQLSRERMRLERYSPDFFSSHLADQYLQLEISDNGIGIAEDERLRVFETFHGTAKLKHHGCSTTNGNSSGVGLGLSLAKGIIEGHGGMIWVEAQSAEVNGSVFKMLLPLQHKRRKDNR